VAIGSALVTLSGSAPFGLHMLRLHDAGRAADEFLPRVQTRFSTMPAPGGFAQDGVLSFNSPVVRFRVSDLAIAMAKGDVLQWATEDACRQFAREVFEQTVNAVKASP
jgi:hypothetical protein